MQNLINTREFKLFGKHTGKPDKSQKAGLLY